MDRVLCQYLAPARIYTGVDNHALDDALQ
eukprot:COSAG05_NODE_19274_length_295_cov_0.744898_1_plen_28_part_10